MDTKNYFDLTVYKENFERLRSIFYKDIYLNGTCIRILGINILDYGPDWNVKRHKHSFFETHHVTENSIVTVLNDVEYEISAGQFYVIPPGTFHSHFQRRGMSHIGFSLRWEVIPGNIKTDTFSNVTYEFDRLYSQLLNIAAIPMLDENNVMLSYMLQMLKMADQKCGLLKLQLTFVQMLIHYSEMYKDVSSDTVNELNHAFLENHITNTVIKFIEENYMQDIDVNDISSCVHLSYSHLSRIFKKYTGKTITYNLNMVRLKNAQRLLLCSDKSLEQIAAEVGFNSVNYFCEIFKKFYNISPGNYKNSKANLSD